MLIREGTSTKNSDQYIAKNEVFNLHFLKVMKVAVLRDPSSEECFSIPYSSSFKFGLIYNPSPEDESASPYMQLKTAGDVMKLKELPRIITATLAYDGGSSNKSVSEGEVLFVRGTAKGSSITKGKQLHVVNVLGEEKHLMAKCSGGFSTDPRHTKLPLPSLLSQDIGSLPQYVIIYGERSVMKSLPSSMNNKPLTLESVTEESSVIATCDESSKSSSG